MTTPNPQPGAAPTGSGAQSGAGSSYLADAGIVAPTTGGSSGGSKYGLGAVASVPVHVGGLLPAGPDGTLTAEQVMEQLTKADPATIAQLQAYLYKGAVFYGSGTRWTDINLGVLGPDDIQALSKAVQTSAQNGVSLSDYIRRQAAWGVLTGNVNLNGGSRRGSVNVLGAASASGGVLTIEKPDPKAVGATIDAEFKKLLGHKPSPAERAGFIAAYTNAYQQVQIENYNRQVAAMTGGGTSGADGISASGAPPVMLPTDAKVQQYGGPFAAMAHFGDTFAQMTQHGDFINYLRNGLPPDEAARGVIPAQVSAQNAATNQRNQAADNAFLALADQPLPGMPGYTSGAGAGAAASQTTTVAQQQAYDPQAFADEWINQHHTAEAGAHSVTDVFSNFLQILHGGMQ